MEERYEIRGKIGQGGLGAVYRGYDTRMNREVAIKRISVTNDDPALQEESTRQLIKEAGALASLQHPHIVTVYDVGSDEDGPYVVMELISGKTLDELIERAPLTWPDFRELALQTEEALIAAQELDLIHSDIKPSNLMLTWLPSGKFQMKIVDFGLATLTQSQSKEDLEELEAVFGSIFFMAPEQFERVPIDVRTDMYAMGCVYYQALTGTYPFKGETGYEVMVSHLHHTVTPLQEVRSDIPVWACDWIMWHINRQPDDRPESARQALQVFLQNDKNPNPTMSLGRAAPVVPLGPRRKLVIPAAGTYPTSKRVIVDPRMAPPGYAPPAEEVPEPEPEVDSTKMAPQPLLPPEGSKPSIHTSSHPIPDSLPSGPLTPTGKIQATGNVLPRPLVHPPKKSKVGKRIGMSLLFIAILAGAGILLKNRIAASRNSQRYDVLLVEAADGNVSQIPISGAEFAAYLQGAADAVTDDQQKAIFTLLGKATPNDNANFEATATEFITSTAQILPEVREALIREVLFKRANPAMVDPLLKFARETKDTKSAIAAFETIRTVAGEEHFQTFLDVTQFHPNADFKKAAADCAVEIARKSSNAAKLKGLVTAALASTTDPTVRAHLQRIQDAR